MFHRESLLHYLDGNIAPYLRRPSCSVALSASKLLPQEDLQSQAAVETSVCLSSLCLFRLYLSRLCLSRLCPYRLCLSRLCLQASVDSAYVCQFDESLAFLGWLWVVWGWDSVRLSLLCIASGGSQSVFSGLLVGEYTWWCWMLAFSRPMVCAPISGALLPNLASRTLSFPIPHPSDSANFWIQIQRLHALNLAQKRGYLQDHSFWVASAWYENASASSSCMQISLRMKYAAVLGESSWKRFIRSRIDHRCKGGRLPSSDQYFWDISGLKFGTRCNNMNPGTNRRVIQRRPSSSQGAARLNTSFLIHDLKVLPFYKGREKPA